MATTEQAAPKAHARRSPGDTSIAACGKPGSGGTPKPQLCFSLCSESPATTWLGNRNHGAPGSQRAAVNRNMQESCDPNGPYAGVTPHPDLCNPGEQLARRVRCLRFTLVLMLPVQPGVGVRAEEPTQRFSLRRRFPSRPLAPVPAQGPPLRPCSLRPRGDAGRFARLGIHTHKHTDPASWPYAAPGFPEDFCPACSADAQDGVLARGGEREPAGRSLVRPKRFRCPELVGRAGAG